MKQTFVRLAKFGNSSLQYVCNQKKKSTNKNSITYTLQPAVFSVNSTQFPHGIAFMVRMMEVFSF